MYRENSTTVSFFGARSRHADNAQQNVSRQFLLDEALALGLRLKQVKPFSLTMPMVAAAHLPAQAQKGIDQLLLEGKQELREKIGQFIRLLRSPTYSDPEAAQKSFAFLKLRFNALLDQLDIFADVISQRSEHHTGVWLAGLDALIDDALSLEPVGIQHPPLVCYLDRGHGAAIRRARTRLPGGKSNPVAVIRVPRERMVSNGIASSLVHEVGHQGTALLALLGPLRLALRAHAGAHPQHAQAWRLFERWISEIVSDFWAVATLGVGGTTGLMGVVSLPRYFMFRMNLDDPHPFPWIRVKISLAFGRALYPDPQWERLEQLWEQMYPTGTLKPVQQELLRVLSETLPHFVRLVLDHRPASLQGMAFREVFPVATRQPEQLRQAYRLWRQQPNAIYRARPGLVFAAIGQARADSAISPDEENRLLTQVLRQWALMKNVHL